MEVLLMKMPMADDAIKQEEIITPTVDHEEGCGPKASKEDELESAKEENERLKMMLKQIEENYKSLQLRFFEILQQGSAIEGPEEPQLVSLSLGRTSTGSKKDDQKKTTICSKTKEDDHKIGGDLTLELDSKFQLSTEIVSNPSHENSSEEPRKVQKTASGDHEEAVEQKGHVKRARVSVRTRCDARTVYDGCQWRKYGQKMAKGNPCPRAYYRCAVAPGCPVRKQVQRSIEDMSILIATYEGNHNHPLPLSATAIASTTAAAASMVLSGSSTSQPGLSSTATTTTLSTELNGLNFGSSLHDNSRSPSCPTITLDLTGSQSSSSSSNYFNRFPTNFPATPRFPSTNLNFSSPVSNILPSVWGNGGLAGNLNLGKGSIQEQFYQQSLTESLTKAITSDPSFRSVISAAISSMVDSSAKHGDQTDQRAESLKDSSLCASSYFKGFTSSCSKRGSSHQSSSLSFSIFNGGSGLASDNKERKN